MNEYIIILFSIIGTSVAYIIGRWIYQRLYFPFFIPIVVASVFMIIFLISFNISYDTYMLGGNLISKLLGPAVVALAYPLYSQRALLKRLAIPIVVGTFVGAIIGIVTGVLFAKWLHFDKEIIYSLSPKSVTTPIAMEVAKSLGGHMSLAAVFVIIAGIAGAVLHRYIFKLFRLKSKVSRGVGMGSGSHAIGTAKALENSEVEGSASTVAMILSMIFVSLLTPVLVGLIIIKGCLVGKHNIKKTLKEKRMKRKNVLVSAYFAQNVGDDLFLKSLFDRYENVNWYLLTSNKRYEKMFESYSHVNTFFSYREVMNINMFISWARLVNHFKKYDAFIKIGGSIFMQNKEWEKTFERRHQLMNILKKHNIPTFIIGANFGPYEDEIFKKKYEDYFINYDYICFRDSYSYNLFKHLSNVSKAPDAVLTLNVKKQRQQANCIGISPISLQTRPDLKSYANRYYKKIGEIIVHYLKQNNIVKLFSFCQYEGDEESIEHILQFVPKRYKNKIIIVNYEGQLDLFLEAFQQCTKVIGTRFHSLILAMKFKQSFLPIIYSDKTVNSFKMIGVQHIGYHIRHIDSLNVKKINHLFNDSINDAIYTDAEKQFFGLDEILKVPNR